MMPQSRPVPLCTAEGTVPGTLHYCSTSHTNHSIKKSSLSREASVVYKIFWNFPRTERAAAKGLVKDFEQHNLLLEWWIF